MTGLMSPMAVMVTTIMMAVAIAMMFFMVTMMLFIIAVVIMMPRLMAVRIVRLMVVAMAVVQPWCRDCQIDIVAQVDSTVQAKPDLCLCRCGDTDQ